MCLRLFKMQLNLHNDLKVPTLCHLGRTPTRKNPVVSSREKPKWRRSLQPHHIPNFKNPVGQTLPMIIPSAATASSWVTRRQCAARRRRQKGPRTQKRVGSVGWRPIEPTTASGNGSMPPASRHPHLSYQNDDVKSSAGQLYCYLSQLGRIGTKL